MSWTTERVEQLKKLWIEGLSASQIAAELGGVTRNAVIGKVHRLGLSGRAKTTAPAAKTRRPRTQTASTAPTASTSPADERPQAPTPQTNGATALKMEPAPEAVLAPVEEVAPVAELVPLSKRTTILNLTERTCKWPIGDPSTDDFYFCGHPAEAGVPYCPYHCKIAYQPVADRRRDKKAAQSS